MPLKFGQDGTRIADSSLSFQGSRGLLQRCHGVLQCSHRFSRFHVGFLPLINRRLGRLTWKFCTRGSSSGRPRGTAEDQSDCAAPIHSCLNLDVSRARLNSEPGRSQLAKRRPHCQVAFNGAFNGGRPVPRSVVFLELSEACTAPPTNSPPTRGLQIAITLPGLSCHSFSGDKPGFFGTIFVSNRMECGEKSRLIEEHSRVALAYSRAARALRGKRGTRSAEGQQALDEARIKSQDARAAVKRHIAEHGC